MKLQLIITVRKQYIRWFRLADVWSILPWWWE